MKTITNENKSEVLKEFNILVKAYVNSKDEIEMATKKVILAKFICQFDEMTKEYLFDEFDKAVA